QFFKDLEQLPRLCVQPPAGGGITQTQKIGVMTSAETHRPFSWPSQLFWLKISRVFARLN
ncbi:MAG: hypothetical protein ACRD82_21340, partial [Blastocatellia bacterium]